MQTETLIIGAGLSGLSLATQLAETGQDYLLVEARDRIGGRILTERSGAGYFDLGPSWFWPGQPRIAALISRLGLERFDQYSIGALSFEDEQGRVERGRGFASMEGSYRVEGGLAAVTNGLAAQLKPDRLMLSTPIVGLTRTPNAIVATGNAGQEIKAKQVVLALPPRVASRITFSPVLPQATRTAMTGIATWMAGQAKAFAVYETPFWREAGLSGDAMSRCGPMVEIHDASPAEGGPYALFGFIGVPPQARQDASSLHQALQDQLIRLFGPKAADPIALFVKDWAFDRYTAIESDQRPLTAHPAYGLPQAMSGLWDNALIFAGTEVATQFGGYVEGALEAAENAMARIERKTPAPQEH
ncbi:MULTISPECIES: NAD(P)/FAD-dependent oxidoreductase [unclassified Ruegeria]|uniref:flavin monoamine oxidase family protein n=1 Tax=unclassified Ruegeria TaxID=2625375 RepID=UPI0014894634|nr:MULTISPECIES: NAD(P)/FAD-dependent oxidoreductase [unclassified Ruegeria]